MLNRHFVLFDDMEGYADALAVYLGRKQQIRFSRFTSKEALGYCKDDPADLLLVAEHLYEPGLSAYGRVTVLLTEEDRWQSDLPCVCRYQSADSLLSGLYLFIGEEEGHTGRSAGLIGIYSPNQDPMQTLFAWKLAQTWNQKENVLYVNLNENAGFSKWLSREYERDISDLLFLSTHREGAFSSQLAGVVCSEDGLDYLPPMENGSDAFLMSQEVWITFFNRLVHESGYERILCDFGCMLPGFFSILKLCDHVYVPQLEGQYQQARSDQFSEMIRRRDRTLSERFTEMLLPKEEYLLRQVAEQIVGGIDGTDTEHGGNMQTAEYQ